METTIRKSQDANPPTTWYESALWSRIPLTRVGNIENAKMPPPSLATDGKNDNMGSFTNSSECKVTAPFVCFDATSEWQRAAQTKTPLYSSPKKGAHMRRSVVFGGARDELSICSNALLDLESVTDVSRFRLASPRDWDEDLEVTNSILDDENIDGFRKDQAVYYEDENDMASENRFLCPTEYLAPSKYEFNPCVSENPRQPGSPTVGEGSWWRQHMPTPKCRSLISSLPLTARKNITKGLSALINLNEQTISTSNFPGGIGSGIPTVSSDTVDEPVEVSLHTFETEVESSEFDASRDLIHGRGRNLFFVMQVETFIRDKSLFLPGRDKTKDQNNESLQEIMLNYHSLQARRSRLQRAVRHRKIREKMILGHAEVDENECTGVESASTAATTKDQSTSIDFCTTRRFRLSQAMRHRKATNTKPASCSSSFATKASLEESTSTFNCIAVVRLVLYLIRQQSFSQSSNHWLGYDHGPLRVYASPEDTLRLLALYLFTWATKQNDLTSLLWKELSFDVENKDGASVGEGTVVSVNPSIQALVEMVAIETDLSRDSYIYAHSSNNMESGDNTDDDDMIMELAKLEKAEEDLARQLASATMEHATMNVSTLQYDQSTEEATLESCAPGSIECHLASETNDESVEMMGMKASSGGATSHSTFVLEMQKNFDEARMIRDFSIKIEAMAGDGSNGEENQDTEIVFDYSEGCEEKIPTPKSDLQCASSMAKQCSTGVGFDTCETASPVPQDNEGACSNRSRHTLWRDAFTPGENEKQEKAPVVVTPPRRKKAGHIDLSPNWSFAPLVQGFSDISDISAPTASNWSLEPNLNTPIRASTNQQLKGFLRQKLETACDPNEDFHHAFQEMDTNKPLDTSSDNSVVVHSDTLGLLWKEVSLTSSKGDNPAQTSGPSIIPNDFSRLTSDEENDGPDSDGTKSQSRIKRHTLESILAADDSDDSVEKHLNNCDAVKHVGIDFSSCPSRDSMDKYDCGIEDERSVEGKGFHLRPTLSSFTEDSGIQFAGRPKEHEMDMVEHDRCFPNDKPPLFDAKFDEMLWDKQEYPETHCVDRYAEGGSDSERLEDDIVMQLLKVHEAKMDKMTNQLDPPGIKALFAYNEENDTAIVSSTNSQDVELVTSWNPSSISSSEDPAWTDKTPLLGYHHNGPSLFSDASKDSVTEGKGMGTEKAETTAAWESSGDDEMLGSDTQNVKLDKLSSLTSTDHSLRREHNMSLHPVEKVETSSPPVPSQSTRQNTLPPSKVAATTPKNASPQKPLEEDNLWAPLQSFGKAMWFLRFPSAEVIEAEKKLEALPQY